jgi:hypothetical protein
MVSAGIDILELSEQPEHLLPGQTCPTVTKSKLYEVSLVDVGSNDDAIILMKDGKQITLGRDGECPLPSINNLKKKKEKTNWTRHWKASEKTTRCLTTIQTDTTTRTALTTKKWFTATLPLSMIS